MSYFFSIHRLLFSTLKSSIYDITKIISKNLKYLVLIQVLAKTVKGNPEQYKPPSLSKNIRIRFEIEEENIDDDSHSFLNILNT